MPQSASIRTSPIITRAFKNLRADRNLTMAEIVKHSVITTVAEIPKFSGESDTIDLNQYIKRIDTLIKNKGISEDSLKIECFKEHIDAVKGTARHVITYSHLDNIKTYDEYVKCFKKHFTTKSDRDPIRAMVKFLRTAQETSESQTAFISRLDAQAKDIEQIFTESDWSVKNSPNQITLKNMAKVMMLAQVIKSNKSVVQERLYKDIKPDIQLGEVDCLLKGYAEMDPTCSQYVLTADTDSRSTTTTTTQHQSRKHSQARNSTHHRGRSPSAQRTSVRCYNCNKVGHTARHCFADVKCANCQYRGHKEAVCRNPPWCSYHKMIGHQTVHCRARQQNFQKGQSHESDTT